MGSRGSPGIFLKYGGPFPHSRSTLGADRGSDSIDVPPGGTLCGPTIPRIARVLNFENEVWHNNPSSVLPRAPLQTCHNGSPLPATMAVQYKGGHPQRVTPYRASQPDRLPSDYRGLDVWSLTGLPQVIEQASRVPTDEVPCQTVTGYF